MHVNREEATASCAHTHTQRKSIQAHTNRSACFSLLICDAILQTDTDFKLRGRKTTRRNRKCFFSSSLTYEGEDNDPFVSQYLEYELFEEEKHEGSERDDLLLGWPRSI